jgi:hypothetical protein
MGYWKGDKVFYVFLTNWQREEAFIANHIHEWDNHWKATCIIFGRAEHGWRSIKVQWENVLCVGRQPSATSLDALYHYSSSRWPLLAHCSGFHHVGYERGIHPPPHYNGKHEQVRFKLNTMDFKILVLSIFFLFLTFYIEVEVLYQFCFNPLGMLNLITWSLVRCMISSASKALTWFHWSNSGMWSISMSTRDVKTRQKRLGTL